MKPKEIREIIETCGRDKSRLLPVIKAVQNGNRQNFISQEEAYVISQEMAIRESEVYEAISFFAEFSEVPRGEHVVKVCDSTVCRVNGNRELVEWLEDALAIRMGETTEDGLFTLEYSPCFGACDISPAIRIGEAVYGNMNREKVAEVLDTYRRDRNEKHS